MHAIEVFIIHWLFQWSTGQLIKLMTPQNKMWNSQLMLLQLWLINLILNHKHVMTIMSCRNEDILFLNLFPF